MWFFPLAPSILDDDVADSNAAPLTIETPNLQTLPEIAPLSLVVIRPVDAAPTGAAIPFITGTGGAVTFADGFKIHQFTSTGAQTLTFARGPRGT